MIQKHSIILWKKAGEKTIEEISDYGYRVLDILQEYPIDFRPNYLTALSKNEIKKIEWNRYNFTNELMKGVNKEGGMIFNDLGYSISFLSSLDKQNCVSISLNIGNSSEKFYDILIIGFPISWNFFDKNISQMIYSLFERLVQVYMPFWGCVSNRALYKKYGKYLEKDMPTSIYWINYWSKYIVDNVGINKIWKIEKENPLVLFRNGILSIKDIAIDANREDDIKLIAELREELF